ncbi:MAG: glutamate-1-semialdehyde 2,1-aminomutase [Deltaproteobacteria bacterium]|nr:glutamate-1-semialdehyde 2,1-aminomutase [Deltaproteobacteria bacterium]
MDRMRSKTLYERSLTLMPGGVNSPARSFKSVETFPSFIERAYGSRLWDVDGNEYIDYVGSWGPAIVGHAHEKVVAAIHEAAMKGISFGAATEGENKFAELVLSAFPAMDRIRLVSTGTEACMTALRLARACTSRDKFIKFSGNYHGHSDFFLSSAGSGLATLGIPACKGVPKSVAETALTVPFNDTSAVKEAFRRNRGEIAAVFVEPFVGNAGFIRPGEGFLETLREICSEEGSLLVFDEVITGFRVAWGGAQAMLGIEPDLTTLGKVIGGGLPLAALGGKLEFMNHLAPIGQVYQAGTLSGNPLAVACGLRTLSILAEEGSYDSLSRNMKRLIQGIQKLALAHKLPLQVDGEGGLFGLFFSNTPVHCFEQAKACDQNRFLRFFHAVLKRGLYWAPSAFEAGFLSLAHSDNDILETLRIVDAAFQEIKAEAIL